MYNLYWGDLHSHCSISYGHGTIEQALLRARDQLDFCSITGHAFWPDMPTDRRQYGEIIDYHTEGFARLAANWQELLDRHESFSNDGTFIAFPSYEWHSLEFGDHNVYSLDPKLPLRDSPDLAGLRSAIRSHNGIAIPHHIGYQAGYRGINWDAYCEDASPFVEIFSLHGCSLSENAPYPMLHDMGPRDAGSTAEEGWARGHRFGIVGGTDHHAGYPGSHGDGRMGVFAEALTPEALWEAFRARRTYAATGDCIDARLFLNDAWIGESVKADRRQFKIRVNGSDSIDRVELLKNGRIAQRFSPRQATIDEVRQRYRLRMTWGWGRKDKPVGWRGCLGLSDGSIRRVETCFSGQAVVAPQADGAESVVDSRDRPHILKARGERMVCWESITVGNLSMRHETTQALSLEIEAPLSATISVDVNNQKIQFRLQDLLRRGRTHFLRGWLSEAIRVGPVVPIEECTVEAEWTDDKPELDVDVYRLQVAQHNNQWAWLTPIWAERS